MEQWRYLLRRHGGYEQVLQNTQRYYVSACAAISEGSDNCYQQAKTNASVHNDLCARALGSYMFCMDMALHGYELDAMYTLSEYIRVAHMDASRAFDAELAKKIQEVRRAFELNMKMTGLANGMEYISDYIEGIGSELVKGHDAVIVRFFINRIREQRALSFRFL